MRATLTIGALTGVLALSDAIVDASPAIANLWMHSSCVNPDGSPAPNEGWSGLTTGTPSVGSSNNTNCSPTQSMYAFLSTQSPAPAGAGEALQYTPPKGSTLVGGTIHVGLSADGYGVRAAATAALFEPAFSYDAANVFLQCVAILAACQNGTFDYYGPVELPRDRGGSLFVGAGCMGQVPGTVCNNAGSHNAWALVGISYAHLLLSNTTAPSATEFRGSLLSGDAHGSATLGFTATDPDVGVYKVQVFVDDRTLYDQTPNPNAGKCVPAGTDTATGALIFTSQTPCPQSQAVNVAVRTTGLADGPHELIVNVVDAAQNTATVLRQTITTNNRSTVSAKLSSDAPSAAGPVYAIVLDAPTQTLMRGVRRAWKRSALTLSGTLHTSAGIPAPGVAVTLLAQHAGDDATQILAHTSTDAAGHWILRAPRGASRTLTISTGNEPSSGAGAVTIRQSVRPGLSLHVKPRGGGWLRFSGRLRIAPLGNPRPLIVIQALSAKGWQAVGSPVRVSASGAYSLIYNGGPHSIGGHYALRATAPSTRLFGTAISPIRRTVVR
jgi:hypothetical protein